MGFALKVEDGHSEDSNRLFETDETAGNPLNNQLRANTVDHNAFGFDAELLSDPAQDPDPSVAVGLHSSFTAVLQLPALCHFDPSVSDNTADVVIFTIAGSPKKM